MVNRRFVVPTHTAYARHVGRVGALAVALGVGVAVATTPGVAFADDTAKLTDGNPSVQPPKDDNAPNDNGPTDDGGPGADTTTTTTTTGTSASTTVIGGGSTPQVTFSHSGGSDTSGATITGAEPTSTPTIDPTTVAPTSSPEPTFAPAPVVTADPTTATPTPSATPALSAPPSSSTTSATATVSPSLTSGPLAGAATLQPQLAATLAATPTGRALARQLRTVDDVASNPLQANAISALQALQIPAPVQPQPTPLETLVAIPGTIISTALNLITQALAPLIGPGAPADNPVLWAVLAFVRREFTRNFANSTPVLAPRQTSQDLDDAQVHGTFGATDADGDTLTYTVPTTGLGAPAHGTVTIDQAAGTWTYTPTTGYTGEDYFYITATDAGGSHVHALGQTHATVGAVSVMVTGTSVPPVVDPDEPVTFDPALPSDPAGTVRGRLHASDLEGRPLTYAGSTVTSKGSFTVNADGSFLFAPSGAAQHAAAADGVSADVKSATFAITITAAGGGSTTTVVTVPVAPRNAAPSTPKAGPTISAPIRGVVVGSLDIDDVDGDNLTYELVNSPASGSIRIDPSGTFVYTPRSDARSAAASTPTNDVDSFTVVAKDGYGGQVITTVTVSIAPSRVIGEAYDSGPSLISPTFSADSARVAFTTYDAAKDETQVALYDTATGALIGNPIAMAGGPRQNWYFDQYYSARFTEDSTRVLVTTGSTDAATGQSTTRVALFDVATGTRLGTGVALPGEMENTVSTTTGDGARTVIVTTVSTPDGTPATQVVVLDMRTGSPLGTSLALPAGSSHHIVFSPDGERAAIVTQGAYDPASQSYPMRVTLIDTTTNRQVGDSIERTGDMVVTFTPDGDRAIVGTTVTDRQTWMSTYEVLIVNSATGHQLGAPRMTPAFEFVRVTSDGRRIIIADDGESSTSFDVVDTATGLTIGTVTVPGTLDGRAETRVVLSPDEARAVLTTETRNLNDGRHVTTVAVLDVATGTQVGNTVTVDGIQNYQRAEFINNTRIGITTNAYLAAGYGTTVTLIDATTGNQLGSTISLPGYGGRDFTLNADKTLLALVNAVDQYDYGTSSRTYVTSVAVVDVQNGQQIGTTMDFVGAGQPIFVGDDLLIRTAGYNRDSDTSTFATHRVELTTGDRVTNSFELPGGQHGSYYQMNGDGTVGVARTVVLNDYPYSGNDTYHLAFFDPATGSKLGDTLSPPSGYSAATVSFAPTGNRATYTLRTYDETTQTSTMHLRVFDTASGAQLGETLNLLGSSDSYGLEFTPDGSRIVFTTSHRDPDDYSDSTFRVAVLDATTGSQLGEVFELAGDPLNDTTMYLVGNVQLNANGTRAIVATRVYDYETENSVSGITVIDIVTGEQIGETLYVTGTAAAEPRFAPDGKSVVVWTRDYDYNNDDDTRTYTTRVTNLDVT